MWFDLIGCHLTKPLDNVVICSPATTPFYPVTMKFPVLPAYQDSANYTYTFLIFHESSALGSPLLHKLVTAKDFIPQPTHYEKQEAYG